MLPQPADGETQPVAPPTPPRNRRWWITGGVAAVLVAIAVAVVVVITNNGGGNSSIVKACENTVQKNLVSPATAKFSNVTSAADPSVDGRSNVTGDVDSQNGFGALLRSTFTCQVDDQGDGTLSVTGEIDGPGASDNSSTGP
jgi:hypothetical protein